MDLETEQIGVENAPRRLSRQFFDGLALVTSLTYSLVHQLELLFERLGQLQSRGQVFNTSVNRAVSKQCCLSIRESCEAQWLIIDRPPSL